MAITDNKLIAALQNEILDCPKLTDKDKVGMIRHANKVAVPLDASSQSIFDKEES